MPPREHVANIGERGATRRRRNGYLWIVLAVILAGALLATHAARPWRLLVGIPVGLAALGLLQSREKT